MTCLDNLTLRDGILHLPHSRDTAIAGYIFLTERNRGILTKGTPRSRYKIYLQSRQVRETSIYILVILVIVVIIHSNISNIFFILIN